MDRGSIHKQVQGNLVWQTVVQLLTDGTDKVIEGSICKERLRKFPEEHFECSGGHMDVLPLTVIQVQLLI